MPAKELLIAAKLALIVVMFIVLALSMRRMRDAKRAQDRLIDGLDPATAPNWFRVAVSRPGRRWTWLGYEARGVLVNAADGVRVLAELPSGERIDRSWRKPDLPLRWEGNGARGATGLHWFELGSGERALRVTADTTAHGLLNAVPSREATADICRMIAPRYALPDVARADFASERSPAAIAAVVLMLAALAYAIVDGVIIDRHELLDPAQAFWGMPLVLLLALPFLPWQRATGVPAREAAAITVLLAAGLAAAYLPAVKRLDQALGGGTHAVAYRLGPGGILAPVEPGPPAIDYSRFSRYWDQFETGSLHEFQLVRGPLGLWQHDRTGIEQRMHAWFAANPPPGRRR